jgi:hypothetical protein
MTGRLVRLGLAAGIVTVAAVGPRAAGPSYSVRATTAPHDRLMAASDEAWRPAAAIEWGKDAARTAFRALRTDRGLYVRFDAWDDKPWSTMTRRDDHLWEEEVVEVFLDLDRSGTHYAEIEINPANVVCDVEMIQAKPWNGSFDWNMAGLESEVTTRPAASIGQRARWIAVALLPWDGFRSLPSAAKIALPPHAGDRWRFNVFRVERPGGPANPKQGAINIAWSPPSGDSFHEPAAFRDLVFEK